MLGACSTAKVPLAAELGACDAIVDYSTEDIVAAARAATGGEGVACVIDGVGATTHQASLDSLRTRGICIFFGNASGPVPPISPLALVPKSLYITRPKLNDYTTTREELERRAGEM